MRRNSRHISVAIAIAAAVLLGDGAGPVHAAHTVVKIQPTSTFLSPSSAAQTWEVRVDNVHTQSCSAVGINQPCGLGGYTIELHFDPNVLACVDKEPAVTGCQPLTDQKTYLKSTGRAESICLYNVDNDPAAGVIKYSCTTSGQPPGSVTPLGPDVSRGNGSGILAKVHLKPIGPANIGTSNLDLTGSILTDITGIINPPICHPDYTPCTVQNGTVTVNYRSDLSMAKTGPASVTAPGNVTYNLTATNTGPDQATGVSVVDTLPAGTSFVSASPECAYDGGQHKVTCSIGAMTASQNKNLSITVSAPATLAGSSLSNTAQVTATSADQNSANNQAQATTSVDSSNVNITKTAPVDVALGAAGQYVIEVSSTGPSAAGNVVVTDQLPVGVVYGSSTPPGACSAALGGSPARWTVTCNLGDMASGASTVITLNVTFPTGSELGLVHPDPAAPLGTYVGNAASVTWTKVPPGSKSSGTKWTYVGLPDTDGDGCHNYQELGTNPAKGGLRDPNVPYDFYDVPTPPIHTAGAAAAKDRGISGFDSSSLAFYSGIVDNGAPNGNGADYDDDRNFNGMEDGLEYDFRKSTGWGPDGGISGFDASALAVQGGHSCVQPF